MQSSDAQLLAAGSNVLCGQHSGVGRGLVTVGLDLHSARHTADGLAATGITQVSLMPHVLWLLLLHLREIGDMNEGVVEGGEDAGNAEDEFAWSSELAGGIVVHRLNRVYLL